MDHACSCKGVGFGGVPGIHNVLIGTVQKRPLTEPLWPPPPPKKGQINTALLSPPPPSTTKGQGRPIRCRHDLQLAARTGQVVVPHRGRSRALGVGAGRSPDHPRPDSIAMLPVESRRFGRDWGLLLLCSSHCLSQSAGRVSGHGRAFNAHAHSSQFSLGRMKVVDPIVLTTLGLLGRGGVPPPTAPLGAPPTPAPVKQGGGDMRFAFFRIFRIFFRIFWAGPLV